MTFTDGQLPELINSVKYTCIEKTDEFNFGIRYTVLFYDIIDPIVSFDVRCLNEDISSGEIDFTDKICSGTIRRPSLLIKSGDSFLKEIEYTVYFDGIMSDDIFEGLKKILNRNFLKSEYDKVTV